MAEVASTCGQTSIDATRCMDAKICSDGQVSEVRDISIDDLITIVDEVEAAIRP